MNVAPNRHPVAGLGAEPLGGPTVLRIALGMQLRRLREASGVSREQARQAIRASEAKISRMELGRVSFKERDVADLLTLYGVTDERERASFLDLVKRANAHGWWHRYSDVLPNWFEMYIGLEQASSVIRCYEAQFVPGLLQTEDVARAVICLDHLDRPDREIERRVALRMHRQQVLTRPDPPDLWAVVDEAVLRRPLGGRQVHREQLRHLLTLAERPNITVQVIPFGAGGHAAAGGPFTILRFAAPDLPDVVYLEQLTSALYLDKKQDTTHYQAVMDRLCVQAEPPNRTAEFLHRLISEI